MKHKQKTKNLKLKVQGLILLQQFFVVLSEPKAIFVQNEVFLLVSTMDRGQQILGRNVVTIRGPVLRL